ncbi:MAG: glycine cleavage system aminomethyltransferase GcvT, partial [Verrucomicrobiae bacterium]|nr:glycine cleavage system aminomethyltransferase GcvT [Verrucomicrobiae bacterium]
MLTALMLKRTALYEAHRKLAARLVEFAGWEMPLFYTGIVEEHLAVRTAAGMFDISHMGEITVSGPAARDFLNQVLTNDVRRLAPGRGQYTLMCNQRGGTMDDLYVFQLSEEVYLLVVNAARTAADVAWLAARAREFPATGDALHLTDASHNYAALAVQGPRVREFIELCLPGPSHTAMRVARLTDLKKNQIGGFPFGDATVLVSRTGYTGEDGFEIIGTDGSIRRLWDALLEAGRAFGLKPCGLGARDTLRIEVGYPLYGQELDENTTPLEAGLDAFVALDKGDFVGRAPLLAQKTGGLRKKCIAFRMVDKSPPPRPHYPIWAGEQIVGSVTSGTQSPSLGTGIGMGYVPPELAAPQTPIQIEIREKRYAAQIAPKPLYR